MYRIGVDLGGTNIVAGVVDEHNNIISKESLPTLLPKPADEIMLGIKEVINKALEKASISLNDIISIGIGTPGTVDKKYGVIEYANNLGFDNYPMKNMLSNHFDKPIYLENDANCAALGEAKAGAGEGVNNFVAITLGTGVGSGIVLNGKILEGINGAAGEMGHMVIVANGEPCTCGRRGCWEAYSSATGLIRMTKEAMDKDKKSLMWMLSGGDKRNVNGRTSFDAMRKGDKTAAMVVNEYIGYLAIGITNLVNIFQPDIICLGGGVANEGESLLEPLRELVEKAHYSIHCERQTKICKARLGNDAGIIGAALLG
ncbi:MAG: ROK family protein [Candidatus Fimenecus sp.]